MHDGFDSSRAPDTDLWPVEKHHDDILSQSEPLFCSCLNHMDVFVVPNPADMTYNTSLIIQGNQWCTLYLKTWMTNTF